MLKHCCVGPVEVSYIAVLYVLLKRLINVSLVMHDRC